ncbi:lachesin-like [Gigantopelta aegis]|uniref:lachesin-like n=1 Tax=Gigantopelta aegis TaxID=1735272 RepID=UPI001B88DB57|nr:lachesin-like [Gigantopelta aegis]
MNEQTIATRNERRGQAIPIAKANARYYVAQMVTKETHLSRSPLKSKDRDVDGVAVGVLPRFEVPVVNVTVVEGTTAILPCSVNNLGRHKVVWMDQWATLLAYKDNPNCIVVWTDQWATTLAYKDKRIIDDERYSIQRPFESNWNLHIEGVKHDDQGQFICQVNTKPVQKQTVVLNVLVPPRILGSNLASKYVVKEGMSVSLICNVTGIPAATVTWYKLPTDIGSKKERIGFSGEILKIHNVTRYCSGKYECVADNGVPPPYKRELEVAIEFPPEIRLPNKRIGQVLKKETILDCIVTAYPQAVSVWKFKGRELSKSSKHNVEVFNEGDHKITLSLRIKDIGKEDYGLYTCVASNSMGRTSKRMELYGKKPL